MNHHQGYAGPAENRLSANQPSSNSSPANRGKLIMFPIGRTSHQLEAVRAANDQAFRP
jgi:hypothetical protein